MIGMISHSLLVAALPGTWVAGSDLTVASRVVLGPVGHSDPVLPIEAAHAAGVFGQGSPEATCSALARFSGRVIVGASGARDFPPVWRSGRGSEAAVTGR
ncbi:hypothetical protein GCM10007979_51510 [Nocardioides albus]|nr:hypothetical protein GCM10007979_51510 [Nocardioides albus]